jgi:hypothetical protein
MGQKKLLSLGGKGFYASPERIGTLLGKVLPMQVEGSDLAGTYDLSGHQRHDRLNVTGLFDAAAELAGFRAGPLSLLTLFA